MGKSLFWGGLNTSRTPETGTCYSFKGIYGHVRASNYCVNFFLLFSSLRSTSFNFRGFLPADMKTISTNFKVIQKMLCYHISLSLFIILISLNTAKFYFSLSSPLASCLTHKPTFASNLMSISNGSWTSLESFVLAVMTEAYCSSEKQTLPHMERCRQKVLFLQFPAAVNFLLALSGRLVSGQEASDFPEWHQISTSWPHTLITCQSKPTVVLSTHVL